jgi:hypothetical protein
MKKWKQPLLVLAVLVGALLVGAVVVGILNATVANGALTFGWTDFRYDEEGYTVGEGSVYAKKITGIAVDWLDGSVEIVPCRDTYVSVTEKSASTLPESAKLRWKVDENGLLTVKSRKSGWVFTTANHKKDLILRVPEQMLASIGTLSVSAADADVRIKDVPIPTVAISCKKGNVEWRAATAPDTLAISLSHGDVKLCLPQDASFRLEWPTKHGKLTCGFEVTREGDVYTAGEGKAKISVSNKTGNLLIDLYQ